MNKVTWEVIIHILLSHYLQTIPPPQICHFMIHLQCLWKSLPWVLPLLCSKPHYLCHPDSYAWSEVRRGKCRVKGEAHSSFSVMTFSSYDQSHHWLSWRQGQASHCSQNHAMSGNNWGFPPRPRGCSQLTECKEKSSSLQTVWCRAACESENSLRDGWTTAVSSLFPAVSLISNLSKSLCLLYFGALEFVLKACSSQCGGQNESCRASVMPLALITFPVI